jgi:high-affinity Fe2+/Pb2+ permease
VTDLEMWSLLVGAVMPPFVAIIQQPKWPDWFRTVVAVAASILVGFVTTWLVAEGQLWERGMITAILLVLVAALTTYRNVWRTTGIAPAIEAKTNIG